MDPLPRRAWVEQVMGLPVSVHLRGPAVRTPEVERSVAAVFAELHAVDAMFSTYRAESQISRLNRGELDLAGCDPLVHTVDALCEEARRRTEGYFDARLPGPSGGTRYDPSGLVKGWAVARAVRRLAGLRGQDACLNAGGDVVVATAPGHPPWQVGIEDPADPARLLRVLTVAAGGVATSGRAHRGAHIVDPHTGRPAGGVRAVTVTGPSLLWADVYATAAAARGPEAITWLARIAGYEAMLVDRGGMVFTTRGWTGRRPATRPA